MGRKHSRDHEYTYPLMLRGAIAVIGLVAVIGVVVGSAAWSNMESNSTEQEIQGVALGQVYTVHTLTPGRLSELPVQLYQTVKKGEVLAVIDSAMGREADLQKELQAQQATIQAQISHLQSQLAPTRERLIAEAKTVETQLAADARNFALDVETARLRTLELRNQINTDRLTLDALAAEIRTTKDLVDQDVLDASVLQQAQLRHNTLLSNISEKEAQLNEAKTCLAQAQVRLGDFQKAHIETPSVEDALEVIHKEIEVYTRRMDEIAAQMETIEHRKALHLTAPFDGVVSRLLGTTQQVVDVNLPILILTEHHPTQVVAYISNDRVDEIQEGMAVEVAQCRSSPKTAKCPVIRIAQVVERLPQQLWHDPTRPEWGRPFLIDTTGLDLVVGEKVDIRMP